MNEYLIRTSDPSAYDQSDYRAMILAGSVDSDFVLDILHTSDPTLAGDSLIGGWAFDGSQVAAFDQVAYEQIRPLGNNPPQDIFDASGNVIGQTRGGDATGDLLYHHFSGWGQRQLSNVAPQSRSALYPDDNQPFDIEVRHKEWVGQTDPGWNGWGWRAEMHGDAAQRDPGVYAIGVYSDPECTIYEYTTGAFVQGPSDWQTDEDGNPLIVWFTETPLGFANPTKIDWHLAVLFASIQAGYQTLSASAESIRYLFWAETQLPPSSEGWVNTGATVISQAGTLYQISDAAVAAALTPGQAIRFGDGAETTFIAKFGDELETTFVGVWPGGSDYIEIDPFVQAQIGDVLWAWGFSISSRRSLNGVQQWYRSGGVEYQLVPGPVWMMRWRKPNGESSQWQKLSVFLSSSIFNRRIRREIYDMAVIFNYKGKKPR